jgi:hypothetical protein
MKIQTVKEALMRKKLLVIVALVAVILCLQIWQGADRAAAAEFNILPYYTAGNVGDYWNYDFVMPVGLPGFTNTLTQESSGLYRLGSSAAPPIWYQVIFDYDSSGIYFYEDHSTVYSPPVKIDALQPLNEVSDYPFPDLTSDHSWYFQKLGSSLTVPAGTFDDVALYIFLDKYYGPNDYNAIFGLDPATIPYAVAHARWYAAGIGEIQHLKIDPGTGFPVWEYQLKATSVSSVPLPAPLVMLGSGLLGLWAARRRFSH